MDLTFQVPMQYCSLQYQTLHSSPHISTTGHCFCFGSASLFLLELFLHSSPVAYWAPTDLGSSSLNVISFRLFIPFTGFSRQKCWSGLPFPCPMDHVLSELSTMTHSFIVKQGCDPFDQFDYFSVIVVFILSALWWMRKRDLWKLPDGRNSFQFSHSVVSDFATPHTAAQQGSLSITNSPSLIKLMSVESVMPSNYFILCHPFLLIHTTGKVIALTILTFVPKVTSLVF